MIWIAVVAAIAVLLALFFRVRTMSAHGACTENVCPPVCDERGKNCRFLPGDDCCHDCWFGGWSYRVGEVTYEAAGRFPECDLDGCGRCAFELEAWGLRIPLFNRFVVLSYSELAAEPSAPPLW